MTTEESILGSFGPRTTAERPPMFLPRPRFSFVDAVTGFNQIKNTRRAMEVLAIVARSGKFLPVCLTFGPVNGPDDFCYVVDRA